MDDLRCPMCGKPNPRERDVCRYCQARLRPVWDSSDGAQPSLPGAAPQAPDPDAGLPDWLHSFRSQSDEEAVNKDEPEEALPDWLRAGSEPEQAAEGENDSAWVDDPGNPDPDEAPQAGKNEVPDWLQSMRHANYDGSDQDSDEDESDWLAGMRSSIRADEDQEAWRFPDDESTGAPARFGASAFSYDDRDRNHKIADSDDDTPGGELPDWLTSGSQPDAGENADESSMDVDEAGEETGVPDAAGSQDLPDWLMIENEAELTEPARPADDLSEPPPQQPGAAPGEPEAETPEQGAESQLAPNTQQSEDAAPPTPSPAGSNWPNIFHDTAIPSLDQITGSESDDDLEDVDLSWLDELEAAAPDLGIEKPLAPSEPAEDVAPFLQGSEAAPGDAESFLSSELPDWLSPASVEDKAAAEDEQLPPEEADLMQADLPNWVEAMRPVGGDHTLDEPAAETGAFEGVGPLSGLRGVLPAETGISPVTRPPAYANKLQVTEAQQAHVETLKALLQAEGQPQPIPRRATFSPQHLLRVAIFVALLVVVGLPMLAGYPQVAPPAPDVEAGEIFQHVDRLPPAAPVLLVVDYEPGLSGEMDAALSPLVDHLMLKGTYLALVSTSATGPLQAERLLKMVNESGPHTYLTMDHYVNLGYIPGGAVGLQAFAQNPRQVARFSLNPTAQSPGITAWQAAPMQDLHTVDDFSMIVVAADNPDTVRIWVEQVEPYLVDSPLVAVVSAQAEPLVRPYYQSHQVDGLLAGLPGGLSYAGTTGRGAAARTYWPSFSLALLGAALLILAAGSLNAVSGLLVKRRETLKGRA